MDVPVIDISPWFEGDPAQRAAVVTAVGDAIASAGFLQIVGHGMDEAVIDAVYEALEQLDSADQEIRDDITVSTLPLRGLFDHVTPGEIGSHWSYFSTGYDTIADAEAAGVVRGYPDQFRPNQWPRIDGFEAAVKAYRAAARRVADVMLAIFAEALPFDLAEAQAQATDAIDLLSSNWYQGGDETGGRDSVLLYEHADGDILTVLSQRGTYDGLEIGDGQGGWQSIPNIPGALVINLGHVMGTWSGGRWPVTMHRVTAGPLADSYRASLAYFLWPNFDMVVTPAQASDTDGVDEKPLTFGDMQRAYERRVRLEEAHEPELDPVLGVPESKSMTRQVGV